MVYYKINSNTCNKTHIETCEKKVSWLVWRTFRSGQKIHQIPLGVFKQTRWASCSKTCPSNRKFTRYNLHHLWILFYVNTFLLFSAHEKLNELSFLITVSGVVVNICMDSYKKNISQDPIFCSQLFFLCSHIKTSMSARKVLLDATRSAQIPLEASNVAVGPVTNWSQTWRLVKVFQSICIFRASRCLPSFRGKVIEKKGW